ncbi:ADP-ribosyl cyclase/cyclic ADP-ribose hydrolase-like [Mercenaria mercenaria]|uniref:ADP-ribosyl cyclase/cyclic ADP-ribose hydrolase-like n=1 Tax=Mercenaria mercenaria TaxID=6596 RepID=UPI00234EB181|nr:ADP-ribosyl cyclase/cyclic ADP-ribose hydrolase-like [Mercenaria mercenaria]
MQILFYSGTSGVAHEFSNQGRRFVTLEDTRIGYLVDGLNWCGVACHRSNKTCDGINYKECPHWSELPEAAAEAFWGGASAKLARSAVGEARVMITSTNPEKPAYRENSFFAKFELQSMPVDTKLKVILANEPDKEALEDCNSGSLLQLKEDAAKKGISVTCEENPP